MIRFADASLEGIHIFQEFVSSVFTNTSVQDDDSEYASDSSDDERRLARPVFVTKSDRETVVEKEKAELEAAQLKEDEQKRKEAREVRVSCIPDTDSL